MSVHSGDNRFSDTPGRKVRRSGAEGTCVAAFEGLRSPAEIGTGTKGRWRTGQYDRSYRLVAIALPEIFVEELRHLSTEGVSFGGLVEREHGYPALDFDEHRCAHAAAFTSLVKSAMSSS